MEDYKETEFKIRIESSRSFKLQLTANMSHTSVLQYVHEIFGIYSSLNFTSNLHKHCQ